MIDPAAGLGGVFDVLIEDDRVVDVAKRIAAKGERIDASGCWVVPGLIDMHVHLREPGYEYKETVATGTASAVAGGFTAVACMANTNPVNDSAVTIHPRAPRKRSGASTRSALSAGLSGRRLAEIGEMREAGIVAVSDDGMPVADAALMRRALEYTAMFGIAVIAHEEDPALASDGVMHEGATSFRLGLKGMPAAAEEVMIARDVALVERTGGRLHVAHLSTAGSVELVRHAKARGLAVTAEVAPHHFILTEEAVEEYDSNAKMKPPLRTAADVKALIQGLRDGTIDAIATDHAPHHRDEKEVEFEHAANGIVGLETALPLALRLTREAGFPIETMVQTMSINPARILGIPCGSLARGGLADLAVIDPKRRWTVDAALFRSKSRNTPFGGWEMEGGAVATIVGGRVVWRAEERAGSVAKRQVAKG